MHRPRVHLRRWRALGAASVLVLGIAGTTLSTGVASASSSSPAPVCTSSTCTVTFAYTGSLRPGPLRPR